MNFAHETNTNDGNGRFDGAKLLKGVAKKNEVIAENLGPGINEKQDLKREGHISSAMVSQL